MSVRIFVCDDEKEIRDMLVEHLKTISIEIREQFIIDVFSDAVSLIKSEKQADILLLDIAMDSLDGLKAAHILRDRGDKAILIFITTMTQFALQGYEVHAYGFLEKPIEYEKLKKILIDAVRVRKSQRGQRYEIHNGAKITLVNLNDVLYFEAFRHDVHAVLSSGKGVIDCSNALGDLELDLAGKDFFRCHKSYLINLRNISSIDTKDIIMNNGYIVPLSRYKKQAFLDAFAKYRSGLV